MYSLLFEEASDAEEGRDINSEWGAVLEQEEYELDRLLTTYWQCRAARNRIPLPDRSDDRYWEASEFKPTATLTTAGIDYIENKIYEKRKKRWEIWLALGPILIGIIGGLTGLIAVLRHVSG